MLKIYGRDGVNGRDGRCVATESRCTLLGTKAPCAGQPVGGADASVRERDEARRTQGFLWDEWAIWAGWGLDRGETATHTGKGVGMMALAWGKPLGTDVSG